MSLPVALSAQSSPAPGAAAQIRRWVEQGGPVFIKIGQFLALRPDLIPQEYCDELLGLFDQAPEFAWDRARSILTEDLGEVPERRFAWIDPRPLAAASLAQVHLAMTHQGERVCVKIQREGIHEQVQKQLRHSRPLRRLLEVAGIPQVTSVEQFLDEFAGWLERELDFRQELVTLTRMYELYRDDRRVRVPKPFPELSGRRVVTSEYLKGTPFTALLPLVQHGDSARIARLGIDPDALAENLIRSVLEQIFEHRWFHADPHPGNLIALPDNKVGFVDFGLVDSLDDASLQVMTRYLTAIYSGDVERMFHALRQFLVAGPHADPEKFHDRFVAETRTFMRTRADEPRPAGERSPFVQYLIAVVRAARESDLRIPAHLLSMYRTLVTAESVAQKLGADAQLRDIGRAFFARLQIRNSAKVLEPPQAQALGADLLAIAKDGPGFVHRILSDLADERFLLHVRATQTREDRIEANRRARLVSTSVLTVALSILLASTKQIPGLSSFSYATPVLGALLAVAVIYVLLIWRRLS